MDTVSYIEPIVLIDQTNSRNKQAHLLVDIQQDFENLVNAGQRVYPNLFQGDWSLSYLDPKTKTIKGIEADQTPADFFDQGIDTFLWNYQPVRQNKYHRRKSRGNVFNKFPFGKKAQSDFAYSPFGKRVIASLIDLMSIVVLWKMLGPFGFFIPWLYYAFLESSKTQATVGKMAMNMKVMDQHGEKLSFGRASWRFFAKIATSFLFVFGYLLALITPKKQALHDILSATIVVDTDGVIKEKTWSKGPRRSINVN